MKFLHDIRWDEIEAEWKRDEDSADMRELWTKKGFVSWEDWRWARNARLGMPKRTWKIYETENSPMELGSMYCDATTSWTRFYCERMKSTFRDLQHVEFLRNHPKIDAIRSHYPEHSQIISLRNDDRSIVLEGHHRAFVAAGFDSEVYNPSMRVAISDCEGRKEKRRFEKLFNPACPEAQRHLWDALGFVRAKMRGVIGG